MILLEQMCFGCAVVLALLVCEVHVSCGVRGMSNDFIYVQFMSVERTQIRRAMCVQCRREREPIRGLS